MTVDVRPAAEAEARVQFPPDVMHLHGGGGIDTNARYRDAFKAGAAWAAERLTPTREELAKTLFAHPISDRAGENASAIFSQCESAADAVLALMQAR